MLRSVYSILYAKHELGNRLKRLSEILDKHPEFLSLITQDLCVPKPIRTGACGLSVESVFRCLLLKQIVGVSYEKLSFHLCDSITYRSFARLNSGQAPDRSRLQSTIRRISPKTLEQINRLLIAHWVENDGLSVDALRIDSTVVADGCNVGRANVGTAKRNGVKRTVFNKPAGFRYSDMGFKKKLLCGDVIFALVSRATYPSSSAPSARAKPSGNIRMGSMPLSGHQL